MAHGIENISNSLPSSKGYSTNDARENTCPSFNNGGIGSGEVIILPSDSLSKVNHIKMHK